MIIRQIFILYVRLDDVLLSTSVTQRTRKTKLSGILSVIHSEWIVIGVKRSKRRTAKKLDGMA